MSCFNRLWDEVYLLLDRMLLTQPVRFQAARSPRRSVLVSVCHRLHPRCLQIPMMHHWCCLQRLQKNSNPMIHYRRSVLAELLSSSVFHRFHRRPRRANVRAVLGYSHLVCLGHRLLGKVHHRVLAHSIFLSDAVRATCAMALGAAFPSLKSTVCA